MKFDYVYLNIDDSVAIVTIDRPPVNALNSETYGELFEVFYKLHTDNSIKVIILTGSGEKAFAAGADINEFLDLNSETGLIYTQRNQHFREYVRTYSKPVICAVNGLAYGGGLALALVCDIRIACKEAKFNMGEINMGIVSATQYVASIVPSGIARKLVYSGEAIDAREALMAGVIDEVVDREDLMERCLSLAKKIASKSPLALKYAKKCMLQMSNNLLSEGLAYEEKAIKYLWGTEDKNEAVSSFLEKREAKFKGK